MFDARGVQVQCFSDVFEGKWKGKTENIQALMKWKVKCDLKIFSTIFF
jgi:hypothetical protein